MQAQGYGCTRKVKLFAIRCNLTPKNGKSGLEETLVKQTEDDNLKE